MIMIIRAVINTFVIPKGQKQQLKLIQKRKRKESVAVKLTVHLLNCTVYSYIKTVR